MKHGNIIVISIMIYIQKLSVEKTMKFVRYHIL